MNSTCQATVFYDEVGEASARLYALAAPTIDDRLLTVDELAQCRFDCRVEGPTCRYSTTLQSRITLKHRGVTTWGDIPAVMAEGILPDPCPWSPELPFLYRVVGTVRLGERTIAEIDQTFGIRPLSTVRNQIKLNGKTWVPRIVGCVSADVEAKVWRDTATVRIGPTDDESLREASELGVICCACVNGIGEIGHREVRRLSRYSAVTLIQVEFTDELSLLSAARNTLFLSPWSNDSPDDLAQIRFIYICPPNAPWEWPTTSLKPIIVMRPALIRDSVELARDACDALQADIAGKCDPAGYAV